MGERGRTDHDGKRLGATTGDRPLRTPVACSIIPTIAGRLHRPPGVARWYAQRCSPRGPYIHLKICPSMMPTAAMPKTMARESQSDCAAPFVIRHAGRIARAMANTLLSQMRSMLQATATLFAPQGPVAARVSSAHAPVPSRRGPWEGTPRKKGPARGRSRSAASCLA